MGVAHVLDGENKAGLILVDGFSDIAEKTLVIFPAGLLPSLCQRNDLISLTFRHCVIVVKRLVGSQYVRSEALFFSRSDFLCGVVHLTCFGWMPRKHLSLFKRPKHPIEEFRIILQIVFSFMKCSLIWTTYRMLFTKPQNGIRTIHIQPSQLQLEVCSL